MKQIRNVLLFSSFFVLGLKADLSFTATFAQSSGFVSPTGSFGVPVTVTNSPTSTEDIVFVENPFLDFDLLFPDGTRGHNRYYMGRTPTTAVDIAPGASLTVFDAFFMPAERFSAASAIPPDGTIFEVSLDEVQATFADGSIVSVTPGGTFSEILSSTPEPATWLLLSAALAPFIARGKKRSSS